MSCRIGWIALIACLAAPLWAADAGEAVATVTYVSGRSVYVDAGSEKGIAVGDLLRITRDGVLVATVEIREVTVNRSVGQLPPDAPAVTTGDRVHYRAVTPVPEPETRPTRSEPRRRSGLRGHIGLSYLTVRDDTAGDNGFSQPALVFRLSSQALAGSPWGLDIDARTRRTTRREAGAGSDGSTRVYRFNASRTGRQAPWRIAVGRQYASQLAAVSTFDGLSFQWRKARWSVGGFSGSQPDADDYGFGGDVKEHGAYFELHQRPDAERRWSLTTGLIGSYEASEVNREFLYLQGRYSGPRLFVYAIQEVDFNRDWKADLGESSLSATSTLLSLRWKTSEHLVIRGGVDSRRRVRLYRDRETPITEFDDALRRGSWIGVEVPFEQIRFALEGRVSDGGAAGSADSASFRLSTRPLTRARLSFRQRSTRYTSDLISGWLHSAGLAVELTDRTRLELYGGTRDEEGVGGSALAEALTWYGVDFDIAAGRRWFWVVSLERSDGDLEQVDQLYTALNFNF